MSTFSNVSATAFLIADPSRASMPMALSPQQEKLRFCRRCYDHLAGQVGVAMTRALQDRDYIRPAAEKQFIVTPAGMQWFAGIGLDVAAIVPTRRGLARQCLDWTERSHHLAGPLGVQLMARLCAQGWLRRSPSSRAVAVTPRGWIALQQSLGLTEEIATRAAARPGDQSGR